MSRAQALAPAMLNFITELRVAHAIFLAHRRGAHSVGQIAHRTGLPAHICAEWVGALHLPIESPAKPRPLKLDDLLRFDI